MKTKLLLVFLLFCKSTLSYSQKHFDLTVHQDTKFIFVGDKRGNNVGTVDILLKIEVPVIKFPKSYITVFPSYEYANLNGGTFKRYSVGAGYIFKGVYFKNINIGLFSDFGFITRNSKSGSSFGFNTEISYKLTRRVSLSYVHQITERSDLKFLYNDDSYIKPSSLMGFKVHF